MNKPPINKNSKLSAIIFPIIILILVSVTTGTLYYLNNKIKIENNELSDNIKEIDKKIKETKKNKNLRLYDILTKNKKTIDKLNLYSQIPRFMEGFDYIKNTYKISLDGFNYSNGNISTSAISYHKNSSILPYITTSEFIKKYREDEKAIFELGFITGVNSIGDSSSGNIKASIINKESGKRNMKFKINLKIKDNTLKKQIINNKNKNEPNK